MRGENNMKKLLNNYLACFILGSICLLAAVIFAPIWNFWENCPWKTWGLQIVNLLIASIIVCYLAMYLAKKLKHTKKRVILVLTIIEFVLLSLIALGCVFSQFKIINVSDAGQIFALALWIRGCVELFRAYYYRADSNENYPVWYLAISIAMVTLGTYCFAKPLITNILILWLFVAALAIIGILLFASGFNAKNKSKKPINN